MQNSIPTRGRTLDHAARVYDALEPILLLGKQAEYDRHLLSLLNVTPSDRILDLGCGTGVLTRMIGDRLEAAAGGESVGIDAAARMIAVARKKRASATCRFEMGKSGSGKSTLLNCVGGLDAPDKGEVVCLGTSIHTLGARALCRFQRRHLGFVFQRGNLLSYLTVAENIGLPLTLNKIGGRDRRRRIEALLEAIDLRDAARALPHELSGGEIQRVSLARAIAHRPKLLLADEPTANLDSATGQQMVRLMLAMGAETGCTILMATHDRDISATSDMIVYLKDGSVVDTAVTSARRKTRSHRC